MQTIDSIIYPIGIMEYPNGTIKRVAGYGAVDAQNLQETINMYGKEKVEHLLGVPIEKVFFKSANRRFMENIKGEKLDWQEEWKEDGYTYTLSGGRLFKGKNYDYYYNHNWPIHGYEEVNIKKCSYKGTKGFIFTKEGGFYIKLYNNWGDLTLNKSENNYVITINFLGKVDVPYYLPEEREAIINHIHSKLVFHEEELIIPKYKYFTNTVAKIIAQNEFFAIDEYGVYLKIDNSFFLIDNFKEEEKGIFEILILEYKDKGLDVINIFNPTGEKKHVGIFVKRDINPKNGYILTQNDNHRDIYAYHEDIFNRAFKILNMY